MREQPRSLNPLASAIRRSATNLRRQFSAGRLIAETDHVSPAFSTDMRLGVVQSGFAGLVEFFVIARVPLLASCTIRRVLLRDASLNSTEIILSMKGMDNVIDDATTIERIAFHINRLLSESGMSRYRLAKNTGESEQTIKSVADGAHNPRVSLVGRIAVALGVKIDDLLKPIPASKKSSKKFQEVA